MRKKAASPRRRRRKPMPGHLLLGMALAVVGAGLLVAGVAIKLVA